MRIEDYILSIRFLKRYKSWIYVYCVYLHVQPTVCAAFAHTRIRYTTGTYTEYMHSSYSISAYFEFAWILNYTFGIFISETKRSLILFENVWNLNKFKIIRNRIGRVHVHTYVLSSGSVSNVSDNAYYYDIYFAGKLIITVVVDYRLSVCKYIDSYVYHIICNVYYHCNVFQEFISYTNIPAIYV